jgi:hypothetical protein
MIKQFYDELIDRIEISPDRQAQPYFWSQTYNSPGHRWPGPVGHQSPRSLLGHRFVWAHIRWTYVESSQTLARLQNPWSGRYFVGSGRAARWLRSRR